MYTAHRALFEQSTGNTQLKLNRIKENEKWLTSKTDPPGGGPLHFDVEVVFIVTINRYKEILRCHFTLKWTWTLGRVVTNMQITDLLIIF